MSRPKCTDPKILAERKARKRQQNLEKQRRFYAANKERLREEQRARVANKPLQYLLSQARTRAKVNGLDFDLEESDFEIPSVCPILGIPISFCNDYNNRDTSISLDRVDNTKGYVKGNVRLISNRANRIKSDANITELENILRYMRGEL